jgi:hypothetical protein
MIYTEFNPLDLLLVDPAILSMVPEPFLVSRQSWGKNGFGNELEKKSPVLKP